ncbi:hypothetical protein CLCR_04438 [Cladophialophora carrionii]|uniref:Uncharacterized protein n=1 Tax=Cladophialophora carrionii TaxID=86049 RepID=A0A1C1CIT0_9EURO|nr:hypothetical protein CLCR_04438 [Cladophialophora carrionii]
MSGSGAYSEHPTIHARHLWSRQVGPGQVLITSRAAPSTNRGLPSLTPRSTILAGYLKFLDDPSLNGKIIEASRDQLFFQEKPPYADGDYSKRSSTVFDPLFEMVHGQPSGLEDIVRPLP